MVLGQNNFPMQRKSYAVTWQSVAAVKRYAQSRYRNLDQRWVSFLEKRRINNILAILKDAHLAILDIPSGYGRFTPIFQTRNYQLINADLNLYALLYQRQTLKSAPPAVIANVQALPFRSNSFDLTFNFRLLQHFNTSQERLKTLFELQRVTRRYAVISIYHHSLFHKVTGWLNYRPRKMNMITKKEWLSELMQSGFRVKKSFPLMRFFHAQHIYLLAKVSS